jgi:hypothetical protein
MPVKLSEIRAQFPMYDGVPDDQLLMGLHKKFYSDVPSAKFYQNIEYDTQKADPTEGMSSFEKFAAGAGKSVMDTARGLGQMVGAVDRKDVAEARKLDAPLMNTTAGKFGDFAGNVATTLPLAFIPGANTVKGASLIGSLTGLAQPSTSTEETLKNIALGGASGGGGVMAGRGAAAGYQAVTGLLRPLTQSGQQQIASEVLKVSATDAGKAMSNIANAKSFVKGSTPTVGQVADDAGLAQLERTLYNNPESQGPLAQAYRSQLEARQKAISDIAGTPEYRKSIEEGRNLFAKQDYADAFAQGIDPAMAKALQPQIDSLMRRPSIQSAKMIAKGLAAEKDIALTNFGSLEGLDWIKKALDNQISKATANGASIGKAKLDALLQTKSDLMATLEQIAPAYKVANDNFAGMSKNINAMDVAKDLQDRLYKNANWGANKEMGTVYQTELTKALDSVKKQTGMNKSLSDVMPANDIQTLEGIARDIARKENAQNLGRAVGSNTMQNMLGQNLVQRIAGPLGMPQSFSQNVLANTLSRPYSFVMQSAQPKISAALGEALADPAVARRLLAMSTSPSKAEKIGKSLEKYLSVPGLLAIENGR